jgi:hypothetical protein
VSPLTALWVASVIGASLFFASGVLSADVVLRRLGVKTRLAGSPQASAGVSAGLAAETEQDRAVSAARDERLINDFAEAQALITRQRREIEALRQQLEVEISTKATLDLELTQQRSRAEDATHRLHETQKSAAMVPTLRKRLEEIEHTQATKARTTEHSDEKARGVERELARARADVERLSTQLAARVGSQTQLLENDVKRLNDQQQERNLRMKMLTDRVAELETYAEENASLRSERDALQRDLERLRRTTREALSAPPAAPRVQVDTAGVSHILRPSQSGTTRRAHQESELTLESSLKQHLTGLIAREPGLIAVLSDDNGFPVAGVGSDQQQESVSVLTSLAQELAFRVKEFVDLERIERMELADGAGRAIRIRFFDWESQALALGCLGKRSLIVNPDEERVVAAFPNLLRRAWTAGTSA